MDTITIGQNLRPHAEFLSLLLEDDLYSQKQDDYTMDQWQLKISICQSINNLDKKILVKNDIQVTFGQKNIWVERFLFQKINTILGKNILGQKIIHVRK